MQFAGESEAFWFPWRVDYSSMRLPTEFPLRRARAIDDALICRTTPQDSFLMMNRYPYSGAIHAVLYRKPSTRHR